MATMSGPRHLVDVPQIRPAPGSELQTRLITRIDPMTPAARSAPITIAVLYYSRQGATRLLAQALAQGIERTPGAVALLRTVAEVSPTGEPAARGLAGDPLSDPVITLDELQHCDGLALGSPTRFGQMAAPLSHFLSQTTPLWMTGALSGKPAAVFTSTGTLHGGQEATLLNLAVPLLHHGMLLVGIPYQQPALSTTRTGGAPYGASHVAGTDGRAPISPEERQLAIALGQRLAEIAIKLRQNPSAA